jgi:hypothetical protein
LTNNNDRHVTNMNSFLSFSVLIYTLLYSHFEENRHPPVLLSQVHR